MRLLYFSHGLTVHDVRFLKALATRHEVHFLRLLAPSPGGPGVPAGVREVRLSVRPDGSDLDAVVRWLPHLQRLLQEVRPDAVQAGPIQSCAFTAALAGCPRLIAVSWGSDLLVDAFRSAGMRWKTSFALARAARLICDADAVRDVAEGEFSFPAEHVIQLPWGTDLDLFRPGRDDAVRGRFGWGAGATVFLSTRSWEPLYGILTLLEAFRRVRQQETSARLILLGGGAQADEVRAFVEAHRLHDAVALPGFASRDELPHFFRASDFYVSASRSDGTSVSLLEAQACGLPVVVSDIAGNREWVEEGVNGWLAPADDREAFTAAMRKACASSAAERERMARVNRAQAEGRADWRRNSERMLDRIDDLAGRA